jgi:hypothetical protein
MVEAIDVSVIGGPTKINVDLDYGPPGKRGSQIFMGYGDPNSPDTTIGQTPELNDVFINVSTAVPNEYLNGYQYKNDDGTLSWITVFKLLPNQYSVNKEISFVDGVAEDIVIALSDFTTDPATVEPENINIQHSFIGSNPVASAISISPTKVTIDGGIEAISFNVSASEFVDSEWTPATGSKTVHLFITVV